VDRQEWTLTFWFCNRRFRLNNSIRYCRVAVFSQAINQIFICKNAHLILSLDIQKMMMMMTVIVMVITIVMVVRVGSAFQCTSALWQLCRRGGRVWRSSWVDRPTAAVIASVLVSSRLDYANSVLYGSPTKNIAHLQRVQNAAARVVTKQVHLCSVDSLPELHWLSVQWHIQFKLASLTLTAIHTEIPSYLSRLLIPYHTSCVLRSSSSSSYKTKEDMYVTNGTYLLLTCSSH